TAGSTSTPRAASARSSNSRLTWRRRHDDSNTARGGDHAGLPAVHQGIPGEDLGRDHEARAGREVLPRLAARGGAQARRAVARLVAGPHAALARRGGLRVRAAAPALARLALALRRGVLAGGREPRHLGDRAEGRRLLAPYGRPRPARGSAQDRG